MTTMRITVHCHKCWRLVLCTVRVPMPSGAGATGICDDCAAQR